MHSLAILEQGANEFQREEAVAECESARRQQKRRKKKERKKKLLVISCKRRTTCPVFLCKDRKKGAAIYKAHHHRNWASLRQIKWVENTLLGSGGERKEASTRWSDLTEHACMREDRQDDLILGRRYIFDTRF